MARTRDAIRRKEAREDQRREEETVARLIKWAQERDARRRKSDQEAEKAARKRQQIAEREQDRLEQIEKTYAGRRSSLDANERSQDRQFGEATAGPDNRSTAELIARQRQVNESIAERRKLLRDSLEIEEGMAIAGRDTAQAQQRISRQVEGLNELHRERMSLAGRIAQSERREQAAMSELHVLMGRLGSTESARIQVQEQMRRNQDAFIRNMDILVRQQRVSRAEAARMTDEFEELNTEMNVARQLSVTGGTNHLGFALQQAAYGVEDFASQIDRGLIPALGGAANNINTIVASLGGPYAIVISTAVIAGIQFGRALGFWGQEAETAEERLRSVIDGIRSYGDEVDSLRDQIELRLDVDFDPDLNSLTSQYADFTNRLTDLSQQMNQSIREQQARSIQAQLDEANSFSNTLSEYLSGVDAVGGTLIGSTEGYERYLAFEEQRVQLREELKQLGGDLTEEERKQLQIFEAINEQVETLRLSEQKRAAVARDLFTDIRNSSAADPGDARSVLDVQQDALTLEQQRLIANERLVQVQDDLIAMSRNSLFGEAGIEHEKERLRLIDEQATLLHEVEGIDSDIVAARERQLEAMELSKEATEELKSATSALTGIYDRTTGAIDEAEETARSLKQNFDDIVLGVNGAANATRMWAGYLNEARLAQQDQLQKLINGSGKQADLDAQIAGTLNEQLLIRQQVAAAEARVAAAVKPNVNDLAELIGYRERELEIAQELASQRMEARSELNSAQDMINQRFTALNKQYALEKQIADERERLNKAIAAGLQTGDITLTQARELRADFEGSVRAAELIADAERERERLREELRRKKDELQDAGPTAQVNVVNRGSAEAQKIIDQARREGQARADQAPIVNELQRILQAINSQTSLIEQTEQVEPTVGFDF